MVIFYLLILTKFKLTSHLSHTIRNPRAVMVKLLHTALTCRTVLRANRSYYLKITMEEHIHNKIKAA